MRTSSRHSDKQRYYYIGYAVLVNSTASDVKVSYILQQFNVGIHRSVHVHLCVRGHTCTHLHYTFFVSTPECIYKLSEIQGGSPPVHSLSSSSASPCLLSPAYSSMFIVAACNPHRGNSLASHKTFVRGSHYVCLLHPTLKFLMWDYNGDMFKLLTTLVSIASPKDYLPLNITLLDFGNMERENNI